MNVLRLTDRQTDIGKIERESERDKQRKRERERERERERTMDIGRY